MVTFHPCVIASNRRKDGTYPVKIRVTFKGVSRRLATNLVARNGDLTRSLHIKSPDLISKAGALVAKMQETLSGLSPFALEGWDVDRVVEHIRATMTADSFRLDFFAFADEYLKGKTAQTRRTYDMALNALEIHLGARSLDVNDITRSMVAGFVEAVNNGPKRAYTNGRYIETDKPRSSGHASLLVMKLAHIFAAAKLRYNDDDRVLIPRSPFDAIPRDYGTRKGQKPVTADVLRRMLDADVQGVERIALDAFLLSFATMGANMADLYAARKFDGGVWVYNRQKTEARRKDGAEMRVTIQPEAALLADRLGGRGGAWLPALHRIASRKDLCTQKVNAALRRWAGSEGLEPFTFYAARKSWATIARRLGIEKATIDEALDHKGDYPLADIYIERSWDLANDANRRVLDAVFSDKIRTTFGNADGQALEADAPPGGTAGP